MDVQHAADNFADEIQVMSYDENICNCSNQNMTPLIGLISEKLSRQLPKGQHCLCKGKRPKISTNSQLKTKKNSKKKSKKSAASRESPEASHEPGTQTQQKLSTSEPTTTTTEDFRKYKSVDL